MNGVNPMVVAGISVLVAVVVLPWIALQFYRTVEAGEIRLVSWGQKGLKVYRGPCKAWVIPLMTSTKVISASAINVEILVTDQTADVDVNGKPAPVKVTVNASAIVSVGETDSMVNTAANKFFSKSQQDQGQTLTDILTSAGRRAINLLKHDQLFNAKSATNTASAITARNDAAALSGRMAEPDEDELAVIIKDACSRELLDLGLAFNSLNIKTVTSDVADARRRESAARAKASADVVQAQEEQRARIAQLEAQQKVNDQEKNLNMQIASNGAAIARAEAEKQSAVRQQREAELSATQITQATADAQQNVIKMEAEGKAQAAMIRAVAEADADAIRMKAEALVQAGQAYMDLKRLELAPALTREVANALSNGQFVNFSGGGNGQSAANSGSEDVLRVVQTLMAAQVITGGNGIGGYNRRDDNVLDTTLVEPEKIAVRVPQQPQAPPAPPRQPIFKPK